MLSGLARSKMRVLASVCILICVAVQARPNILFIMIDDLGWKDLGCQDNPEYHTPHIDRLAKQGMRFTDAYAAAPVCSPTRAAAMTGLAPARLRITNHIPDRWSFYTGKSIGPGESVNQLSPRYTTVAERLKAAAYGTAFIGKWHLSGPRWSEENRVYLPENQGFDINIAGCDQGGPGGEGSFFDPYQIPTISNRKAGEYLPDRLADEAINYMREQADAKTPFFVCLWHYTVHWPIEAPEALYKKYADGDPNLHQKYQAMVEGTDGAVGKVLSALDDLKLADDTLVVFTSDNGPFTAGDQITNTRPLKGVKGYLSDGGIRVPLIVRWPGRIQAGAICKEPVITMDFVPTFLEAAGVAFAPKDFDGESLMPLLTERGGLSRDAIYWHYPHHAFHRDNRMGSVIRYGDFKLIRYHEPAESALFDLRKDIGESQNLLTERPELAQFMEKKLDAWLHETNAAMPRAFDAIPNGSLFGRRPGTD
ncbi:MAG: arylsulfatase A [Rhodothermales bacterium]|jgi:arylsulfatase A